MSETRTSSDEHLIADWQRIRAGTAVVQRRLDDAVEAQGVPAQWFAVLHALLAAPEHGLPMTVLARDLAMTSGGFTKLVDRMAKDGLVDRRGIAGDRRVVHAALTAQGRETAERVNQAYVDAVRTSLLTHVDRAALTAAGQTLTTLAEAHSDLAMDDDAVLLATQRDPALPERRGRGRIGE